MVSSALFIFCEEPKLQSTVREEIVPYRLNISHSCRTVIAANQGSRGRATRTATKNSRSKSVIQSELLAFFSSQSDNAKDPARLYGVQEQPQLAGGVPGVPERVPPAPRHGHHRGGLRVQGPPQPV